MISSRLSTFFSTIEGLPVINHIFSGGKAIGFQRDGGINTVAALSAQGKAICIEALEIALIESNVKPLYIPASFPAARACIAVSLPSLRTLTKQVQIDLVKPKEVDAAFVFQIEPLLPYPMDLGVVEKLVLESGKTYTTLLAFSALKEDIRGEIEQTTEWIKEPEFVIPKACALAEFSELLFPKETHIIIDLSYDETTIVLMHRGLPFACRALPISLAGTQEQADEGNGEHLKKFANDVTRALYSFHSILPEENKLPILFTGQVESDPYILSCLAKLLGHPIKSVEQLPPQVSLSENIQKEALTSFASSIGLALHAMQVISSYRSLNFRQGELEYGNKWRPWKKELTVYYTLMCLLSLLFYFRVANDSGKRQSEFLHTLSSIYQILEREPVEEVHSLHEIQNRLTDLQDVIQKPGDEFPLHADIPRVSDVLAYLATHPKVLLKEASAGQNCLQLETLTYTLVKRPEKGRLKDNYQVRIDMEFTAPNATMAREFHEALIAPNAFVDPKNEVKWSMQRGLYKTSFYLKDKTQYPGHGFTASSTGGTP